jgi:toxin secretion/phage lysis holin
MSDFIKWILGCLIGLGAFLFGDCKGIFIVLIAFICLDYITGVMSAIANKKLSSEIGAKGIVKKIFMLAIVAIGNLIDIYVIGNGAIIRNIVIIFYISNECISIVENAGKLGVPVPKKMLDILAQLKKEND